MLDTSSLPAVTSFYQGISPSRSLTSKVKGKLVRAVVTVLLVLFFTSGYVSPPVKSLPVTVQVIYIPSYSIPEKYRSWVGILCSQYRVPEWFFARIITLESGWDAHPRDRRNPDGTVDKSIAQFNSSCLKIFSVDYNSGIPIDTGNDFLCLQVAAKHIAMLIHSSPNLRYAAAGYNAGIGRALNRKKEWPSITTQYVHLIFKGTKGI